MTEIKSDIVRFGVSGELTGLLEGIREMPGAEGLRYPRRVSDWLGRIVLCRTYARPLLELSHLLVAAERGKGGCVRFFWGRRSFGTAALREYFASADGSPVSIRDGNIVLDFEDGGFEIAPGRVPYLAALLDFTIFIVPDIASRIADLVEGGASARGVSDFSNALSRKVYAFLGDHLKPAQHQRKFRQMLGFLERNIEGKVVPSRIQDAHVLAFWVHFAPDRDAETSADFRTFASVATSFFRFLEAISIARSEQAANNASAIGHDRASGEISPDIIGAFAQDTLGDSPLARLDEAPATSIKFINGRERRALGPVVEAGVFSRQLPLTLARAETFGFQQNRITEAMRNKKPARDIEALMNGEGAEPYEGMDARHTKLCASLEQTLAAALYALVEAREPEALTALEHFAPGIDVSAAMVPVSEGLQLVDVDTLLENWFANLLQGDDLTDELTSIIDRARQAFKAVARQGFGALPEPASPEAHGFAIGAPALLELLRAFEVYRKALAEKLEASGGAAVNFASDLSIFEGTFRAIYQEAAKAAENKA